MRIGNGYDVHKLVENRNLILGGVTIPHETGLLGHSDADVLVHAIIDALFGAAGLGDIGTHFPDTNPKYKAISSIKLLNYTACIIKKESYFIENIDSIIIAQSPKLASYIAQMQENIALALKIDKSKVNIKATTEEHLGFTGAKLGIAASAVVLLNQ